MNNKMMLWAALLLGGFFLLRRRGTQEPMSGASNFDPSRPFAWQDDAAYRDPMSD